MNLMIDTEELKEFQQFWHRVWVSQEDFLEEEDLRRDANPVYDVEVPKHSKFCVIYPGSSEMVIFWSGMSMKRRERPL